MSTRSASIRSGECSSTGSATDGWSSDSACTMAGGRFGAAREHFGHRLAHQRRGIVEQHQQRAFGGGAIVIGEIGNQPGPRQRPRRLCPLACRSGPDPTDELPNDHGPAGLRNLKRHRDAMPLSTENKP